MTYLCVPIFIHDLEQGRRDVALAGESGADIVELRIDQFTDDPAQLGALLQSCMLPAIVTCRPQWEGGRSELPDERRFQLLDEELKNHTGYIDVELKSMANVRQWFSRADRPRVIVSSHDFQGRPERLYNLIADLNASFGDVNKIVWMARTVRDNLEAFEILQTRHKPTIALCMGEAGIISRILAKKFGAFLTFASLNASGATAPGQVTVSEMKRLYRWDHIGADTKVYGVVGSPVGHSMSPAIHNAGFEKIGFNGVYVPLLVNEGYESFKAFMESFLPFVGMDLSGLSITIPHKENALRYLQEKGAEVEPLAASIGAVNTIVIDRSTDTSKKQLASPDAGSEVLRRAGSNVQESGSSAYLRTGVKSEHAGDKTTYKMRGFSTDYAAILDSITTKLGITREKLAVYRIAVIGAGGTGRTAVAALAHYGATVVVYNRTFDRAKALADEFNGKSGHVVAAKMEKLCDSCCQIYLNTTSIGMHPNIDQSPIDDIKMKWSSDTLAFDSIYNPMETKFLRRAREAGAQTIGGVEMFVRQAAAQFEAWTGKPAPIDVMRNVVEDRLR